MLIEPCIKKNLCLKYDSKWKTNYSTNKLINFITQDGTLPDQLNDDDYNKQATG